MHNRSDQTAWLSVLSSDKGSEKSWTVAFSLSLCFGFVGADRWYLGAPDLGIFKAVTLGGLGVWWLVDLCLLLLGKMRDGDGRRVERG